MCCQLSLDFTFFLELEFNFTYFFLSLDKLVLLQISIFLLIVRDKKNFHSLEMDLKIEGDKIRALEAKLKQQTVSISDWATVSSRSKTLGCKLANHVAEIVQMWWSGGWSTDCTASACRGPASAPLWQRPGQ